MCLVGRKAERGHDRLLRAAEDRHERRVCSRDRTCRLERAGQNLVQVDRAAELAEEAIPSTFLLRALQRLGELAHHALHPRVHVGDDLHQPLVLRRAIRAAERPDDDDDHDEGSEGSAPSDKGSCHRNRLTILCVSPDIRLRACRRWPAPIAL